MHRRNPILRLHGEFNVSLFILVQLFRPVGRVDEEKGNETADDYGDEAFWGES